MRSLIPLLLLSAVPSLAHPTAPGPSTDYYSPPDHTTLPDFDCAHQDWIMIRPDCKQFYSCMFGQAKRQKCPKGLLFNPDPKRWRCDKPEIVHCEFRVLLQTCGLGGEGESVEKCY